MVIFDLVNPAYMQMKGGPKFIMNPQKQTFDPRLLDQNAKMLQIMAQNAQMMGYPNAVKMMNPMQANGGFVLNNGMPMKMMGYNIGGNRPIPNKNKVPGNTLQSSQNIQKMPHLSQNTMNPQKPNEGGQKPQKQHNPNSIFVKNIPVDKNSVGFLAGYFTKFGEVNNVSVNQAKNTAVIRFNNAESAKGAYMSKEMTLGVPQVQIVYNPGTHFVNPNSTNLGVDGNHAQKAPLGSNLTFESEEVKKHREVLQKKREIKAHRIEAIKQDNDEIMSIVKKMKDCPKEQYDELKKDLDNVKVSMNKKLQEENEENKKGKDVHHKPKVTNKFQAEKAKKKVSVAEK